MRLSFNEQSDLNEYWYDWYASIVDVRGSSRIFADSRATVEQLLENLRKVNPHFEYTLRNENE